MYGEDSELWLSVFHGGSSMWDGGWECGYVCGGRYCRGIGQS